MFEVVEDGLMWCWKIMFCEFLNISTGSVLFSETDKNIICMYIEKIGF